MVSKGTHRARAVEWNLGVAKTGKEQIAVRFQITAGADEGLYVVWYGYFNSPENAKRSMQSLRYCGWKGSDIFALDGLDANEVEIVVEWEVHEGTTRAKVRWVNEIGGAPVLSKPMSDGQRAAFAARMKGLALTMPAEPAPKHDDYPRDWDQ